MKRYFLPFILLCLFAAANCKTAPADKVSEPAVEAPVTPEEAPAEKPAEPVKEVIEQPAVSQQAVPDKKPIIKEPPQPPLPVENKAKPAPPKFENKAAAKTSEKKEPAKKELSKKEPAKKTPPKKAAAKKEAPVTKKADKKSAQKPENKALAKAPPKKEPPKKAPPKKTSPKKEPPVTKKADKKPAPPPPAKPVEPAVKKPVPEQPKEPPVIASKAVITDVTWMVEQADASFVSKKHTGKGKMFVSFFAKYEGELLENDFQEAMVCSPADMWSISEKDAKNVIQIDKRNKLLTLKHLASGEGEGSVTLGNWEVLITLKGQKPFYKRLDVFGIGGKDTRITEKARGKVKAEKKKLPVIVPAAAAGHEQQALQIPVIKSASRDADTIEVIFAVNDSRIKNGYIYFDVPGEEYYRDSGSMIDAAGTPVNGCRSFYINGKNCQYVLRKDESNKEWFNKATRCFFVVSDVSRVATPWEERHRSISAAAPIVK